MAKKRDFDAFYYGVGMKLDKQSIDDAGQQIEGKLNQVVENVTKEVKKIANAINSGVKDIDTKGLAKALEGVNEKLDDVVDFDPKKLKTQISDLQRDFGSLTSKIENLSDRMETSFERVNSLIDSVSTRLKDVEMFKPTMAKDAFKKDVKEVAAVADLARRALANGLTIPDDVMRSLEGKLDKLKRGYRSIEESGNSLELFTDGTLAKDIIQLVDTLRTVGAPMESVLDSVMELGSKLKDSFSKNGIAEFSRSASYQIEEFNYEIRKSKRELEEYENRLKALPKKTIGIAVLKGTKDATLLDQFDKAEDTEKALTTIIERIKEYRDAVKTLKDEDKLNAYRDLVALTEATEKRLRGAESQNLNDLWSVNFSKDFDLDTNKLSSTLGHHYEKALLKVKENIEGNIGMIKTDIANALKDIDTLLVEAGGEKKTTKPGRPQGTTNKKKTTDLSETTGENFTVSPTLKIDEKKWATDINTALKNISDPESGSLEPIDLRINTESTQITKDLEKIRQAIEGTLTGIRGTRKKDDEGDRISSYSTAFDSSFKHFTKQLTDAKIQLLKFVDEQWKPKLKEAFEFKMTVDGQSKTEAKKQVGAFITTYIDALNDAIKDKPIELKSNIDALIEEIKTKASDIKIEGGEVNFKAGDIELPKQTIGNLMLSVDTGNLAQDDTVRKIYNLLSVCKGGGSGQYDDRIAELKRQIAERETSERKILSIAETRVVAEEKGAEAVERKIATETKPKPQEPPKPKAAPRRETEPKQMELPKEVKEKKIEDESGFDKQQIYNEVHFSIKNTLSTFKDVASALEWVKTEAGKYSETLKVAQEGSEEYFRAQAGLTTLLHQWRYKIGNGDKSKEPFRYKEYLGGYGKQGRENWTTYLKDSGLEQLFPKAFELMSKTAYQKKYDLEEPKVPKKQSSGTKSKKTEETAEEMIARSFEQTKGVAQYVLKLAKWARALGTIANGIDYTITERDFGDRDTVSRNGVTYTKQDLKENRGKIFSKGDRLTTEVLDQFIADYENSEDEEFKELFGLIKTMIEKHRGNQERLNATLKELEGTDVAQKYATEPDKSEYLSKGIKASFGRINAKNGNKNAQAKVQEVLSKYEVLEQFEKLSATKNSDEIQKIVEDIASSGNFDKLINDLSSVKGNMGKSYENLINFMKIFKEFNLSTTTLNEIGFEAQKWIRGSREQKDKYKKEYDPNTGRSYYTDEKIGVKSDVVEKGLRQMIQEFAAIFIDESGSRAFGFNEGKNVVDEYLSGNESFSKIIRFLERAIEAAVDIQTPKNKGMTAGYAGTRTHERLGELKRDVPEYKTGIVKRTEAENIARQINNSQNIRRINEENLQKLRAEMQETISEAENVAKMIDTSTQKKEKKDAINSQARKIEGIQNNIRELENKLANPKRSLDDLVGSLSSAEDMLSQLQEEYEQTPQSDESARSKILEQIEKEKTVINNLKEEIESPQLFEDIHTKLLQKGNRIQEISRQVSELANEKSKKQAELRNITDSPLFAEMEQKRAEANEIDSKATAILSERSQLLREVEKIRGEAEKNQGGILTTEQYSIIQDKENQAQTLLSQYRALVQQKNDIEAILIPYEETIQRIKDDIKTNNETYQELAREKRMIEEQSRLLKQKAWDAERGSGDKIDSLILKETEEVRQLQESLDEKKKIDMESKRGELARIQKDIHTLQTSLKKAKEQGDIASMEDFSRQIEELSVKEWDLSSEISTYDREIIFLANVIKNKQEYIEALKGGLKNKRQTPAESDVRAQLDDKYKKLEQAEAEQSNLQSEYQALQTSENDIVNKELEALRARKAEKEARLKEIDAIKDATNNEALQVERQSLEAEIAQIDKHINEGLVAVVMRINMAMETAQKKIDDANKDLANQEARLKEANKTIPTYTKGGKVVTPEEANNLLPQAQAKLEHNAKEVRDVINAYVLKRAELQNKPLEMAMSGEVTAEEATKMVNAMIPLFEITEKLRKGEIERAEYISKVTDAYVAMQKTMGAVDQDSAKKDAERLADAIREEQRLKQEIGWLKELANTKEVTINPKPIEVPKAVDDKPKTVEVEEPKKEEHQKTTETEAQKKNEEAKSIEGEKQVKLAQQQTAEVQKRVEATPKQNVVKQKDDVVLDTVGKSADEGRGYITTDGLKVELAERDTEGVDSRFATVEKQNEIIEILKAGIKVNGKLTTEKGTTTEPTEDGGEVKEGKKKTPKIPTVGKVDIQSDEIKNLKDIDKSWDIYKSYIAMKEQLDNTLADAKEKGADFTVEDADKIRAIKTEVLNLGKGVISASEQFTALKERSEDATNSVKIGTTDVKNDMMQLAQDRAIADKALITDVSFDEAKQKMTAALTDMNGQTTRLTMNYYEMFDAIVTSSDKTTDSVRKIYKAIEGEMQRFTEAKNLTDDVFGKPILKQSEEYKKYFAAYSKMLESANTVRGKGTLATEDEKNELIALRKEVETTYQAFAKMAKASADFDAKVGNNVVAMNGTQSLEDQMKAFVLNSQKWTKHQRQMIEESWRFNEAQNSASYAVEKNKGQLASMSVIADMGAHKIGQYTEETKKYKSGMEKFLDSLKNKWQEVARYLMTFGSMYRVLAVLRQGITYVKEIDSALTELKKVTDETEESYDRFLKTAAKTADKVGSTIKEIVSSTADWARIGYSLQDAATLAETTAVLLNVSEFQSIDEATSALTSTLQAFSYTAEQSMDVVDVLNEVGNNFAVSSDGIATALKDSASSLVAANNSYEEAVALIASANRVVQDPGSVGKKLCRH